MVRCRALMRAAYRRLEPGPAHLHQMLIAPADIPRIGRPGL